MIYPLILVVLLAGCVFSNKYQPPAMYNDEVIKKELQTKVSAQLVQHWYKKLDDEQLNNLIKIGINNSPDVESSIAKLRQARAQLAINKVNVLPMVDISGGWNYEKASKNIVSADTEYYNLGFDMSWELDIWGKNRMQTEADTANVKAASYSLLDVQISLEAEIASTYIALLKNKQMLINARQNEILQQKIFQSVADKYESGLADVTTYAQAKYLLLNTQASIPQYQSNIESLTNSLSVLVGVLPSQINIKESALLAKSLKIKAREAYDLPLSVVRLRPDVVVSESRLAAQNALVAKSIAEMYPDISFSAVWGYAAKSGSKLFNSSSQTYQYAPLIDLAFLDWHKLQNNTELQKGIFAQYLGEYRKTVLSAVAEIKTSAESWKKAEITLYKKDQSVKELSLAVNNLQKKYDNGLINFSELLTMRQNLIQNQNEKIEAKANLLLHMVAFYKAIGAK